MSKSCKPLLRRTASEQQSIIQSSKHGVLRKQISHPQPTTLKTIKPPSLSGAQKPPSFNGIQKKQLHGSNSFESSSKPLDALCNQEEDELAVFIIDEGDKVQEQIVDRNAHAKISRGRVRVPCSPECILLLGGGGESVSAIPVIPVEVINLEKQVDTSILLNTVIAQVAPKVEPRCCSCDFEENEEEIPIEF